ncbi:hypothetical protein [Paenibacillus sp. Y412MC10]|uniref:hypothetical protein n=1 Tax=Geobacillus sp. (strain Y412MC10) TaxID=481743 RepID=UPI0011AB4D81|nr:hypothetical protein [Paenibacillus sp. Y412MC10]
MSCTQSELDLVTVNNISPFWTSYGFPVSGSRRMFISDNPETINNAVLPSTYATLWNDAVSGQTTVKYRVFLWHLNTTGSTIKVGLTLGNGSSSDTYNIANLKTAVAVTSNFLPQGQCAAAALLGQTLDLDKPVSIANGKVGLIKEWSVPNGSLVGGVMEFDLSSSLSQAMVYKLRSVAGKGTADLTLHQGAVVPSVGVHPRGSWSFSDIQGSSSSSTSQAPFAYAAGDSERSVSISNGTNDNLMTASTSYQSADALNNPGHFGVIYYATFRFTNPTSSAKNIQIRLVARGAAYLGAIRANNITNKIPRLTAQAGPPDKFPTQQGVSFATVNVPAGQTIDFPVKVAHAGGANLPVALVVKTL